MNTETTKQMTTVTTTLAAAVITAAIGLSSPALASRANPRDHDPERCTAYQILAQCDQGDCDGGCGDPAASTCTARCERRYERAIRRANRRFMCGIDICDPDFLAVEVDFFTNKMEQCNQKKCEDHGMPQSCYDHCTDARNNKVARLCDRAKVDRGCGADVVEVICTSMDYEAVDE